MPALHKQSQNQEPRTRVSALHKHTPSVSLAYGLAAGRRDLDFEEVADTFEVVDDVFPAAKGVAFVFINLQLDSAAAFLDCVGNLLGFGLRATRVVASGDEDKGRLDLVDKIDRRTVFPECLGCNTITHGGFV